MGGWFRAALLVAGAIVVVLLALMGATAYLFGRAGWEDVNNDEDRQ